LAKDSRGTMIKSTQQRQKLLKYANMVKDNKLRGMIYFIVLFFYYFGFLFLLLILNHKEIHCVDEHPKNIHTKFGFHWHSGFKED
jgi:hypothetical protein